MKHFYFLAVGLLFACKSQTNDDKIKTLPDLNQIGTICDSLISSGLHAQAANLYFETGQDLENSELFVYAAWQYGQATMNDSAFISINEAINYGMSNPNVLEAYELVNLPYSPIRAKVEQRLDSIRRSLSSVKNFDLVTEPLDSFWPYFTAALADTAQAKEYLTTYIRKGSLATKDYYHKRFESVDNMYRQMIQKTPAHYAYTQHFLTHDIVENMRSTMIKMMHRLSEIYPSAVFPKVYLVPGILTGNGMETEMGLFVAAEMFVKTDSMADRNMSDWQKEEIQKPENMIFVTIHELMHFQQSYGDKKNKANLLGKVITEGACDFFVELLSNDFNLLDSARRQRISYLDEPANLKFILSEFKREMYTKDLSKWMYNGGDIKDRPADLGYALGYKISKSFYERSADKKAAIQTLLRTDDFEKIMAGSEYADRLKAIVN
jgi:hypothetical protein